MSHGLDEVYCEAGVKVQQQGRMNAAVDRATLLEILSADDLIVFSEMQVSFRQPSATAPVHMTPA